MLVAFQGTQGAYSEMALYHYFGKGVQSKGFSLSEEVFTAVENGEVDAAILPVENSIVGNVAVNLDLKYHSNLKMVGEIYLRIKHCLLALPGVEISQIKKVYSHPVALEQCRKYLNQMGMQAIAEYDTAGAASELSNNRYSDVGVISSQRCAELYQLNILSDQIQNNLNNMTRFLVFVRPEKVTSDIAGEKLSLAFEASHSPGALLECLQVFAQYKLNLTKLESRPIPSNPFEYIFYVDFLGNKNDQSTISCLEKLSKIAKSLKIFGNYPLGKIVGSL